MNLLITERLYILTRAFLILLPSLILFYNAESLAGRRAAEPRTVRLVYFLPNDRQYRAEVVQRIKDEIRRVQTFFATQMAAHGYENMTFRLQTDARGQPVVHHVKGQHPDSHYIASRDDALRALAEVGRLFDVYSNVYFVVIDNSGAKLVSGEFGGLGKRHTKSGGDLLVSDEFKWRTAAHELGHAFGVKHNFGNKEYVMSYGPGRNRLSSCSAATLAVHPSFNPNIPLGETQGPTIELLSPEEYPAGSKTALVKIHTEDNDGLHLLTLSVRTVEFRTATGSLEVKECFPLHRKSRATVAFHYDGIIPSDESTHLSNPVEHAITVGVYDTKGDYRRTSFVLSETCSSGEDVDETKMR